MTFGSIKGTEPLTFLVLDQYVKEGVKELGDKNLGELLKLKYNAIADAKEVLGDIQDIRDNFIGFQEYLYRDDVA